MERYEAKEFNSRATKLIQKLCEDYGFTSEFGKVRYSPRSVTFTIRAICSAEVGDSTIEAADFRAQAYRYGLEAADLYATFNTSGLKYMIMGAAVRNHKYPILAQPCRPGGEHDMRKFAPSFIRARKLTRKDAPNPLTTENELLAEFEF